MILLYILAGLLIAGWIVMLAVLVPRRIRYTRPRLMEPRK